MVAESISLKTLYTPYFHQPPHTTTDYFWTLCLRGEWTDRFPAFKKHRAQSALDLSQWRQPFMMTSGFWRHCKTWKFVCSSTVNCFCVLQSLLHFSLYSILFYDVVSPFLLLPTYFSTIIHSYLCLSVFSKEYHTNNGNQEQKYAEAGFWPQSRIIRR